LLEGQEQLLLAYNEKDILEYCQDCEICTANTAST
ncbi:Uncharacterized protein APZ42_008757, partial [Daphnia magna]